MSKHQTAVAQAAKGRQLRTLLAMGDTTSPRESALRTPALPTLAQMILDGREDDKRIKRASKEALVAWFRQSERLNIARTHYKLRGERFQDFAKRIGLDRTTAFDLVKLWKHRPAIMARCLDNAEVAAKRGETFSYPGWRTALEWCDPIGHEKSKKGAVPFSRYEDNNSDERATPQYVFDWIAKKFGPFDLDVAATDLTAKCPAYFTKAQNGLAQEWHGNVWMNPPYSDVEPWVKKACEYALTGKGTVTALLPVWTDAGWFHEYAAKGQIILLRRRIRFPLGLKGSAPFPNMIVRWGGKPMEEGTAITMRLQLLPKEKK